MDGAVRLGPVRRWPLQDVERAAANVPPLRHANFKRIVADTQGALQMHRGPRAIVRLVGGFFSAGWCGRNSRTRLVATTKGKEKDWHPQAISFHVSSAYSC